MRGKGGKVSRERQGGENEKHQPQQPEQFHKRKNNYAAASRYGTKKEGMKKVIEGRE